MGYRRVGSACFDCLLRVGDAKGEVLRIRIHHHPHVEEQPFTRSLGGVSVPEGTARVWVEARDSVHGWNAEKFEVGLEEGG